MERPVGKGGNTGAGVSVIKTACLVVRFGGRDVWGAMRSGAMENLAIELGFEAGRGGRCLEALPLVAAKRVGLKARDRPVGVVVLPVRRTAGRRREGRFLLGWGWPVRGVSSRRYADGGCGVGDHCSRRRPGGVMYGGRIDRGNRQLHERRVAERGLGGARGGWMKLGGRLGSMRGVGGLLRRIGGHICGKCGRGG